MCADHTAIEALLARSHASHWVDNSGLEALNSEAVAEDRAIDMSISFAARPTQRKTCTSKQPCQPLPQSSATCMLSVRGCLTGEQHEELFNAGR